MVLPPVIVGAIAPEGGKEVLGRIDNEGFSMTLNLRSHTRHKRKPETANASHFCLDELAGQCADMNHRIRLRPSDEHFALPDTSPANLILLLRILQRLDQIEAMLEPLIEGDRDCRADPVAAKVELLREACIEMDISFTADGYIGEHSAARLLSRSATTLRNWRYAERPLKFRVLGSRIEYGLDDLAAFLAERSEIAI